MGTRAQNIRRSHFVLVHGPGAIIETRNGPRLIPLPDKGLGTRFSEDILEEFKIDDSRLEIALRNLIIGWSGRTKINIFTLPTNASLNIPETIPIYHTYIFPEWRVCYGRDGGHRPIIYSGRRYSRCPKCNREDNSSALRFVVACTAGHLDDVPWNYAVHIGKKRRCNPEYFYWKAGGSSLADIEIQCPECGSKTTMDRVYHTRFPCTARMPEREEAPFDIPRGPFYTIRITRRRRRCNRKMRVTQRQSSSLYIPEVITLITIPEYDRAISRILQRSEVASALFMLMSDEVSPNPCKGTMDIDQFLRIIENNPAISQGTIQTIREYINAEGISGFCELFRKLHSEERTFRDFIYEEFESLLAGPRVSENNNFKMSEPEIISTGDMENFPESLRIYPVDRIRSVTVQLGYRRMPARKADGSDEEPEPVDTGVKLGDKRWYAGFEGFGEGIFITSDVHDFRPSGDAVDEWKMQTTSRDRISLQLWGDYVTNPLFVWFHTLSHSIIRTISIYAGYSAASLRERVYVDRNSRRGGILIYTTSPGEDASMGGLVGTVSEFHDILREAIDGVKICSNDPLCSEIRKTPENVNGAACYSCLFVSETSCEHGNKWLDRHILLGD